MPKQGTCGRPWNHRFRGCKSQEADSTVDRNGFAPPAKATKGATSPMSTDNKRLHGDGPALTPEKRADDIMRSVLGLNRSELADVYRSQTQDDPTQKLYDLATMAASEYKTRGESIPAHVQALLTSARQQQLPLEGLSLACSVPKILLIDAEVDRITSRRTAFETH